MAALDLTARQSDAPLEKGLKADALGFVSSVVIGVASTAPAYSLAATLGAITAIAGISYQAPVVMVLAFVPMLLVALAFKYLNQADPDCGTTFTWSARAFGPSPAATRFSCSGRQAPPAAGSGSGSPAWSGSS